MEDEVLESAISQMTIDAETAGLGHPDGIINQTAIIEEIRYSSLSDINHAAHLLEGGEYEIIHEEQHASGAYLMTIS